MPSGYERHNISLTVISPGKEYHVYCSYGDFNITCRTHRAARGYVFLHAFDEAVIPSQKNDLKKALLENNSDLT